MTKTHTTNWISVSDGDNLTYAVPTNHTSVENVEVRWRGVDSTQTNLNSTKHGSTDVKFGTIEQIELSNWDWGGDSVADVIHRVGLQDSSLSNPPNSFTVAITRYVDGDIGDEYRKTDKVTLEQGGDEVYTETNTISSTDVSAGNKIVTEVNIDTCPEDTDFYVKTQLNRNGATYTESATPTHSTSWKEIASWKGTPPAKPTGSFVEHAGEPVAIGRNVGQYTDDDQIRNGSILYEIYDSSDNLITSGDKINLSLPAFDRLTDTQNQDEEYYLRARFDNGDDSQTIGNFSTNKLGMGLGLTTRAKETIETEDPTVFDYTSDTNTSVTQNGALSGGDVTAWHSYDYYTNGGNDDLPHGHSINGSGQVDVQFRYDYTPPAPTPVDFTKVHIDGTTYTLPLVDPSDDSLEYSSLRAYVNGEVLSADLVDPSDADASPFRIHTSQHGTLAWRKDVS